MMKYCSTVIAVRVIVLIKCVMAAVHAKVKFFMHRKEKPVQFMIV